jgi:hypothetical protein
MKTTGLDLTSHEMRHYLARVLIAGGASVKKIRTVLGHSSAMITLRTCAHPWPGDDDRTRSVMDATLSVLPTGCGLDDLARGVSAGLEAGGYAAAFLVSQKISAISSIFASRWSATATSRDPLVPPAPASLVASLNSALSCGYFSKWGGLK